MKKWKEWFINFNILISRLRAELRSQSKKKKKIEENRSAFPLHYALILDSIKSTIRNSARKL